MAIKRGIYMRLTSSFARSLYKPDTAEENLGIRVIHYSTGRVLFDGTITKLPKWDDIENKYNIVEIKRSKILQREKPLYNRDIVITVI